MNVGVRTVTFRYQLSDRTLLALDRRLYVQSFGVDTVRMIESPIEALIEGIPRDCDGLLLRSLPRRDARVGIQSLKIAGSRMIRYVMQTFPRYYIDMGQSFEDYSKKFSGKTRSTLNRKVRKFAEHCGGTLRWRAFRQADEIEEFMNLARPLSARTYQEKLLDAGLPDSIAFVEHARHLAANDALRAFLLFDGTAPVSYLYCPIHDGTLEYAYLGYDPAYLRHSVGTVLQWVALESLFGERRFRCFDFTEGESEHKRLFATAHVDCANVAVLWPTITNTLLAHSHHMVGRSFEMVGSWLDGWGLKTRAKRWLRFGRASA